jgi:hypothetical protein
MQLADLIYPTLVYVHLLLFVLWLGADVGVFLLGQHFRKRSLYTLDQRIALLKLLVIVDLTPRAAQAFIGVFQRLNKIAPRRGRGPQQHRKSVGVRCQRRMQSERWLVRFVPRLVALQRRQRPQRALRAEHRRHRVAAAREVQVQAKQLCAAHSSANSARTATTHCRNAPQTRWDA